MLPWLWWKNLLKEESFAAFPRSDSGYVCLISSGSSQQPWRCVICPWLLPSGLCGLHCPRGTQICLWFVDAGAGTFCSWVQIHSELWRPRPWTGSGSRLKTLFSFLKCNAYSHLKFCEATKENNSSIFKALKKWSRDLIFYLCCLSSEWFWLTIDTNASNFDLFLLGYNKIKTAFQSYGHRQRKNRCVQGRDTAAQWELTE